MGKILVQEFDQKRTDEIRVYGFDFIDKLPSGDGVSSATWTVTVHKGTDASPSSMISGAEIISGTIVEQLITGGTDGVTYLFECEAVSDGSPAQTLHGVGLLEVTDDVKAA